LGISCRSDADKGDERVYRVLETLYVSAMKS